MGFLVRHHLIEKMIAKIDNGKIAKIAWQEFIIRHLPDFKGCMIIFLGKEDISRLTEISEIRVGSLFIAVSNPAQSEKLNKQISENQILNYEALDFIDRVKILTDQKGFENVIVIDSSPGAIKLALGVAGVFATIYLFTMPSASVIADLHNTIHYKSLKVIGCRPGNV